MSNLILCMEFLKALREASIEISCVKVFSITSNHALIDLGFQKDKYCFDLMAVVDSEDNAESPIDVKNMTLYKRILLSIDEFRPNIVITTAQNRYLRDICVAKNIPMLSCEFGPLPRIPFPGNRFLSLDGHLSDGPFRSAKVLEGTLVKNVTTGSDISYIDIFKNHYMSIISRHVCFEDCIKIIEQECKTGASVALLTLQPDDWLTWEGALQCYQAQASIVLAAIKLMKSDKLIITFHSDPQGRISSSQFAEIWLSNAKLVRIPDRLSVNTSELFIPFVAEVITVSSNTAISAFLFRKIITPIGNSFVETFRQIQNQSRDLSAIENDFVRFLMDHYCIMEEIFMSPIKLKEVIFSRIEKKYDLYYRDDVTRFDGRRPAIKSSETVKQIHDNIKRFSKFNPPSNSIATRYGRHAIGYLVERDSIGAELGVAAGTFSESLLRTGNFKVLYSIDSWSDHHDEHEFLSTSGKLSEFGDNSSIIRADFDVALGLIPDKSLDFIYVDAYAHTGSAAEIIRKWLPKCKDKVIIAGHDFCRINWPINYKNLLDLFDELSLLEITRVPGVFTSVEDDIFPSFVVYRDIAHKVSNVRTENVEEFERDHADISDVLFHGLRTSSELTQSEDT